MDIVKKRGLAVIFTLIIISILIYSGPVKAITIGISDLVGSITGSNTVSFLAKVDLHTNDVIPEYTIFTISMTNSDDYPDYSCDFDIAGNKISPCSYINVTLQEDNLGAYTLGSSLYGYGFIDGTGPLVLAETNFSGYGYAYNPGYGYDAFNIALNSGAELIYNVTWETPNVEENVTYTISMYTTISDGVNTFQYATTEDSGIITLVSQAQATADSAAVSAVRDELTYELILMDNNIEVKNRVVGNLYLPSEMGGVSIEWNSNSTDVINTTGGVTRPAQNTSVLMTAYLSKGSASSTKIFYLRVRRSVAAQAPDGAGNLNLTETEAKFDFTNVMNIKNIIALDSIPSDTVVSLDFSELLDPGKKLTLQTNNITLKRQTSTYDYIAYIKNGTEIYGGLTWNGIINMPTIKPASDYTAPSGSADVVVDMGSGVELNFSQPVKITIGGMAGKRAAWTRGDTTLVSIDTVCDSLENPTNIDAVSTRECYIDSGSDLVIWTYHFTVFAAYTIPTTTTDDEDTGYTSRTSWYCYPWSECIDGYQTRRCISSNRQTTLRRSCIEEPEEAEYDKEDVDESIITQPVDQDIISDEKAPETEKETEPKPSIEIEESIMDMVWLYAFIAFVVVAIIILLVEFKRTKGKF